MGISPAIYYYVLYLMVSTRAKPDKGLGELLGVANSWHNVSNSTRLALEITA